MSKKYPIYIKIEKIISHKNKKDEIIYFSYTKKLEKEIEKLYKTSCTPKLVKKFVKDALLYTFNNKEKICQKI